MWCARVMVVALNCSGSFVKTGVPWDRRAHGGRRRSDRRRKHHHVGGWTRLEPPSEYLCTVLNSSTDNGVTVSLHLGFPLEAVGEASLLVLAAHSRTTWTIIRAC